MREAIVLVVVSACLALGQAASLGEVKRQNKKESKSLAMREILRELIDELSTAEEQTNEASVPKETNHAPRFNPDSETKHIIAYPAYNEPGVQLGFVEAYDTDPYDTVTLTLKGNDKVKDHFDFEPWTHLKNEEGGTLEEAKIFYRGDIILKKTLDPGMTYNFEVEARDNGTVQKSAKINVVVVVPTRPCLPGYTFVKAGRCLKLVTDPASFSDAQAHCQQDQGEGKILQRPFLAEPKDDKQNQKIAHLLKAMEKPVWIGAKLKAHQKFIWIWRSVFSSGTEVNWTNWMNGEPDTSRCVAMVGPEESASETAGQWVDQPCSAKLPFVCEHFMFNLEQ